MHTSNEVKRHGYQRVQDTVAVAYMCIAFDPADDLATIQSNSIAETPFTGADVSFVENGQMLEVIFNGKSDIDPTGTATAEDDLVVVLCNTTSYLVVGDALDEAISNGEGDRVGFPQFKITVKCPAVV